MQCFHINFKTTTEKKFKTHTQENLFTLFYTKYSKFSHCLSNSKFLGFVYVESLHEIKC